MTDDELLELFPDPAYQRTGRAIIAAIEDDPRWLELAELSQRRSRELELEGKSTEAVQAWAWIGLELHIAAVRMRPAGVDLGGQEFRSLALFVLGAKRGAGQASD